MSDVTLDLSQPRRIHIVGIGGAGMSAIAEVLVTMGHRVSGSDLADSPTLRRLESAGITVSVGHDASQVGDGEIVAVSTAVGATSATNAEVVEARRRHVPVVSRAEILAAIAATRRVIAVSGTHGKTTTSAILATILDEAGLDPSFIVGAPINGRGTGARWGEGQWLVVEADESDGTFLELRPEIAVITSIEPDHLNHYGSFDALRAAFSRFASGASAVCVACADDEHASNVAASTKITTYGTTPTAAYRLTDIDLRPGSTSFSLVHGSGTVAIELPLPGLHNALNAAGAVAVALEIGVPAPAVQSGVAKFPGVARRFERRGEAHGVTFVDDYAHLPSEVSAALSAAKAGDWQRVVCVFQPHRYTRTAQLHADFAESFHDADYLVVTDVYGAGETPIPGVTGKLIVDSVLDARPTQQVGWFPSRRDLVGFLEARLHAGDLCLTLGAGDLTALPSELIGAWQ